MKTAQQGDQVEVYYVKRFQDGSKVTSRLRGPTKVTIGTDHPRLPGLGLALVGMTPGTFTTIKSTPQQAYGEAETTSVHKLHRSRFTPETTLTVGQWVKVLSKKGHERLVRITEIHKNTIVVEASHRWAGQLVELEVELVSIHEELDDANPQPPKRIRDTSPKKS